MKRQEMFDMAAEGLLKQGALAKRNGACRYRTSASGKLADGLACAIGQIIPDDKYRVECENKKAAMALEICGVRYGGEQNDLFVDNLQWSLHDEFRACPQRFMAMLPDAIRGFAKRWNLKLPPSMRGDG